MTLQNFRRCFVVLDWLGRWICVVRIDYQWWLLIGREREENLLQNYVRFKLVHFLYLQCATPRCWASKDDAGVSLKYLWVRKGLVDWRWRAGLLWVLQTQILLFFSLHLSHLFSRLKDTLKHHHQRNHFAKDHHHQCKHYGVISVVD